MRVQSNILAAKLRKIKSVLSNRVDEPTGVLVKSNYLYAGNYEIGIRAKLEDAEIDEEFIIPKQAIEFIDSLPSGIVEITKNDNSISIKCGGIKNKYQTISAKILPEMQAVNTDTNSMTISGEELKNAFNSVLYAVSETARLEVMKGVLLDAKDGELNIVGCDGYRIAWNRIPYDQEFNVIIPKVAVKHILSIGIEGEVSFAWDNNTISVKADDYEIISKVLNGEYINYRKMFEEHKFSMELSYSALSECIKRALICAGTQKTICCELNGDTLHVTAKQSLSDYEEDVKLRSPISEPLTIGLNSRYLADTLGSFKSDVVKIKLSSPLKPILIENEKLNAMILPVRIQENV